MNKPKRLTKKHIEVMRGIKNGADVWGHTDAMLCREIQRYDSDLIWIGKAMADDIPGHMRQPYFGTILTDKGRAVLALIDAKPGDVRVTTEKV